MFLKEVKKLVTVIVNDTLCRSHPPHSQLHLKLQTGQGPQGGQEQPQKPAGLAASVRAQVYLMPPSVQKKGPLELVAHFMPFK